MNKPEYFNKILKTAPLTGIRMTSKSYWTNSSRKKYFMAITDYSAT